MFYFSMYKFIGHMLSHDSVVTIDCVVYSEWTTHHPIYASICPELLGNW